MIASAQPTKVRELAHRALGQLPPFSPILTRLMAGLAQEDFSFSKMADLIEKDTVLAGNVLRLVNSPLYGFRGTVNSIRHAVTLLGANRLRNATLTMSVARMWNQVKTPPGWSMLHFNLHAVAVAILCDLLVRPCQVAYAEGAFVAGLFHDLGLLLVAIALPAEYKEIVAGCQEGRQLLECEIEVLGMTHAELSAEALVTWNLPEPIRLAVRYQESLDEDTTETSEGEIKLSRVLHAANAYVTSTGTSVGLPDKNLPDGLASLEWLGLADRLPKILVEYEDELSVIQKYF